MASSRGPLRRLGSDRTWLADVRGAAGSEATARATWLFVALASSMGASSMGATARAQSVEPITIEYASRRTRSEGIGAYEGRLEAHLESGSIAVVLRDAPSLAGADPAMARRAALSSRTRAQTDPCSFREIGAAFDLDLEAPVLLARLASDEGEIERPVFGGVLHVSPTIASDAVVPLGGHEYVATRGMVIDLAGVNVPAILLEASGRAEHRNDAGVLVGHWSDSYWFDEDTGWVLRRERTEIVGGDDDGYEERELSWVVSAPFLRPRARNVVLEIHDCADPRPVRASPWWRVGLPAAVVVLLSLAVAVIRRRLAGEDT